MKKIKAETFADELKKRMGLDRATWIAQNRMKETNPTNWVNLPTGPIFFKKDKRGNSGMNEKHLKNMHNFWVHTYHILKKMWK